MSAYSIVVNGDGPAAYWRLGDAVGAATAADSSGNGKTATYTSVTLGQPQLLIGDGDAAALYDGSTSRTPLVDTSAFRFPAKALFSIESWIKGTYDANYRYIWRCGNNGIYHGAPSGNLQLEMYDGTHDDLVNSVNAGITLQNGVVYHVVGTYDGSTIRLYLNGALIDSVATLASLQNTGAARFGSDGTANGTWNGTLDEVAVYNVALSAGQVMAHYQAGITAFKIRAALPLVYLRRNK